MKKYLLIIVIFLTHCSLSAQSLMTVEQVYNYDIGDLFIRKGNNYFSPPVYTTTIINNKYYNTLSDTLFYEADIFSYTPAACAGCVPDYDTLFNSTFYFTNLPDTLGAGLGVELQYLDPFLSCIDTTGYTGIWLDSVYYDTTFCNRQMIKTWHMDNGPYFIDTCYTYFEPFYGYDIYGEGIGVKTHYYNTCSQGFPICQEQIDLLFYIKGSDSCGFRPFIPLPSALAEIKNEYFFQISPNPFSTQAQIDFAVEQTNVVIVVTTLLGEDLQRFIFSGRHFTLDKKGFTDGIYNLSVTSDKGKFTKKLLFHGEL